MEFLNKYINFMKKNFLLKNTKWRVSIAVPKKNFFYGDRPRQKILKIEICTWNKKKTNFFLMFIRLPSEVLKFIKKYSFLQKC